jgi:hypothetical protein
MKIVRQKDLAARDLSRPFCQRREFSGALAGVLLCCLFSGLTVWAQQSKPNEYEVKAAYLYNFGRFVAWPANTAADKDDSFAICVIGEDPFGHALDATVVNHTIDGKGVVTRRVANSQEAVSCRILFISSSEKEQLKEILATVEKAGVLTVSDAPEFSKRGGMIEFVLEGNKVRFEVNVTNAEKAGLTLSSDLLKVAIAVRRNPQPGA